MSPDKKRLVVLYREIADHTEPECRNTCRVPQSCCSSEYCELTIRHAQHRWGVELQRTEHPRLPLMGTTGCTAEPHLRPLCSLHTCEVNSWGAKTSDPEWTRRYFEIREEIEGLELKGLDEPDR